MTTLDFAPNATRTSRLGRTDLEALRIGIGCGNGLSADDLDYAIARGVNYVFTSSDFHAVTYSRSWDAIARVCGRGSARRDDVVLVATSYVCDPEKLIGVLLDQMMALRVDHVDVFQWGWVGRRAGPSTLLTETDALLRTADGRQVVDDLVNVAREVRDELRCRGYARYLGVSTHDRALARELLGAPELDVLMIRYNVAHRGAERDVFPALGPERPGIVAFNTAHVPRPLAGEPADDLEPDYVPTVSDLYRFALDRPEIDVVLTGPATRDHVDAALGALERAPLSDALRRYLAAYGDLFVGTAADA